MSYIYNNCESRKRNNTKNEILEHFYLNNSVFCLVTSSALSWDITTAPSRPARNNTVHFRIFCFFPKQRLVYLAFRVKSMERRLRRRDCNEDTH